MAPVEILWPRAAPGKARPKAFVNWRVGRAGVYTPDKTAADEDHLMFFAREAMAGRDPIEGPVKLTVDAVYRPPQSWSGRKRLAAIGTAKVSKPDLDNITKLIKDSLNGIAYADDAQVTQCVSAKWWGERDVVRIVIEPAPQIDAFFIRDTAPAEQGALL